jgi:diguanylate cyclase (GGDEF)-like protein/PAS domain S-box-containing protein
MTSSRDTLLGGTEQPRYGKLVILGTLVLFLLIAMLTAGVLYTDNQTLRRAAAQTASSLAERLADRLSASTLVADAVALDILPQLYIQYDRVPSRSLDHRLQERVRAVPGLLGLTLLDARGSAIGGSQGAALGADLDTDLARRVHIYHRDSWRLFGLWGAADDVTGQPRLILSRAALDERGGTLGTALIAIDVDRAREDVMSDARAVYSRVAVANADTGETILHMSGAHAIDATRGWLSDARLRGLGGGISGPQTTEVGDVVVASALTHDFPLTVYVQSDLEPVLAQWRHRVWLALAALIALGLLVLLFIHLWGGEEKARRLAQARLIASDERLRFALEGSHLGLWDWTLDTDEVYHSEQWIGILGYTRETWPTTLDGNQGMVHPDDLAHIDTLIRAHQDPAMGRFSSDFRVRRADGTWAWAQVRGRAVDHGPDGRTTRIIGTLQDITARKTVELELKDAANIDPMLSIRNRRAFEQAAAALVARAGRHGMAFNVVMIDLDHFKAVNDRYGHDGGDEALRTLCRTITDTLREADRDMLFRLGGEEFCVLLADVSEDDAVQAANRLREAVEATPVRYEDAAFPLTASFGVSAYRPGETSIQAVLRRADWALYEAKTAGRNRACRYRERPSETPSRHGHLSVVGGGESPAR